MTLWAVSVVGSCSVACRRVAGVRYTKRLSIRAIASKSHQPERPQFWCEGFKRWCRRRNIRPRFGALGKHGSIAVVERFIRTLKESLGRLPLVPLRRSDFCRELSSLVGWYNESRPHSTITGRTPNEVYHRRHPANRKPRHEPRRRWPRGSPCAGVWALVRGKPGARLELDVTFTAGHRHLPIVALRRAA